MAKPSAQGKGRVEFKFRTEPHKEVFVAGTFNNWCPTEKKLKESGAGIYAIVVQLPAGQHEYKFVVDDGWHIDPENPNQALNAFGSLNSVVTVE
ncbi:MAG: hypothetical protein HY706_15385 [Candidatus Hydrogenedentes bacterium]|nr:hypothetical protein [Candidatus Hydrogenedentota bacterium]